MSSQCGVYVTQRSGFKLWSNPFDWRTQGA